MVWGAVWRTEEGEIVRKVELCRSVLEVRWQVWGGHESSLLLAVVAARQGNELSQPALQ